MKRFVLSAAFAGLLTIGWMAVTSPNVQGAPQGAMGTTGSGKLRFKLLYTSSHLPAEAQAVLEKAHGGFAIDRRPGKGEIYFALPGAGIIQISADMTKTWMLPTDPGMKAANMHNASIWYGKDGTPFLSFPGNGSASVYITSIDGKLLHTLKTPEPGRDLGFPLANDYFAGAGNFIPTDTDEMDGILYVSTGYSQLDVILTARILSTSPFRAEWYDLAWGGKGSGPGQFGTGHGVTAVPSARRIDVSDRPNAEIDRFTRHGQYLSTLKMPLGSLPCDIDYLGNYAVVGALDGPDRSKGAPVYILENDRLVSTLMIKEAFGLEKFKHIHNAVLHERDGKLYVIAQAWNPGDFAILEQVN